MVVAGSPAKKMMARAPAAGDGDIHVAVLGGFR